MPAIAAEAGALHAAEGRLDRGAVEGVDPHVARLDLVDAAQGPLDAAVQAPAASPYSVPLASSIASSSSWKRVTVTTGPKISSLKTRCCGFTSASTVGR